MALAKANLTELTERINKRLRESHSETYISEVRSGKKGASSLKDVLRQVEAEILREAAAEMSP